MSRRSMRRMRWFDIARVAALDAEIFGADAWTEAFFWAALATPGQSFVVMEGELAETAAPDGSESPAVKPEPKILGFAGLAISGPQSDVLTIASHPQTRGQGVGRALLEHLLLQARTAGCEVIHLDVRSDNTAALGLYQAYGFSELGRRPAYYRGADAVIMRAFLAATG